MSLSETSEWGAGRLALALASWVALPLGVLACSDDGEDAGSGGAASVTTGVTGATTSGGDGGSGPSTGAWGNGSGETGAGGAGGARLGPPYPIVLAHGFFGFEEFAGLDFETYFFEVKADLAAHGEPLVFTPAVDPFNDSTFRGARLAEHIEEILAETGHEKVILVGHSQGGLDARVVAHEHPDRVAAVISFATPHEGTRVADVLLGLVSDPNLSALLDAFVNAVGAPLYDAIGDETAVSKPLHLFSEEGIAAFNAKYPDVPGVFYASIAGRTDYHLGGQACAADISVPFVSSLATEVDPTDPLFKLFEGLLDGPGTIVNDGLVSAQSARHGEFWGCVPADHMDQVGQILGDSPGFGNDFDHKAFYRGLVTHLRSLGY
jgi:triacylglycerol lipase